MKLMFIACVMIQLMVFLPFVSAQQSLFLVTKFSGNDNIDGFARGIDSFQIVANARIPGETQVSRDQVRLFSGTSLVSLFSSCSQQAGTDFFTCVYNQSLTGGLGSQQYRVALLRDDGSTVDSVTKTLTIDGVPPSMILLDVSQSVPGEYIVSWRAQDFAVSTGNTASCVGVKEVVFTEGSKEIRREQLGQRGVCDKSGLFSFTHVASGLREEFLVCATPVDHFSQAGIQLCKSVIFDKQPPVFASDPVQVRAIGGQTGGQTGGQVGGQVGGFSGVLSGERVLFASQSQSVDVFVTLQSNDVASASADFTGMVAQGFTAVSPSEILHPDQSSVLVWRAVPVSSWLGCTFKVRAVDTAGNVATQTLSCGVRADTQGPEVVSLRSERSKAGGFFVGVNTTILAELKEAGVGLNASRVFLNAQTLGLSSSLAPVSCVSSDQASVWVCLWRVTPVQSSGSSHLVITAQSADDLGNVLVQSSANSLDVSVDKSGPTQPELIGRKVIQGVHDLGDVVTRDSVIEWRVKSSGFEFASANLSAFGGDSQVLGVCDASGVCSFSTHVSVSGPKVARATFLFADVAGNNVRTTDDAFIYGILNDANPNYVTSTTSCSPSAIDRATASIAPVRAYCELRFASLVPGAVPVAAELGSLAQCNGTTTGFVGDISLMNSKSENNQSVVPVLAITLQPRDFADVDQISFSCPVSVFSRVNANVISSPENEQVVVRLKFYNQPLGEITKARDEKINAAIDDADNYLAWVGTLRGVFKYAEMICNLVNIFYNIVAAYNALVLALTQASDSAAFSLPLIGAALKPAVGASCITADSFRQAINDQVYTGGLGNALHKFCSFVNCQIGLGTVIEELGLKKPTDGVFADKVWNTLGGQFLGKRDTGVIPFDPRAVVNTKDSLFWSTINLCIPGIIYNLDKLRQVQCRYALCLSRDVRNGFPESVCEDMKNYMTCRYVTGEVFRFLPVTAVLDYYTGLVRGAMSDPLNLLFGLGSKIFLGCKAECLITTTGAVHACLILKTLSTLGQSYKDISSVVKGSAFEVGNDWCDQLADEKKKLNESQSSLEFLHTSESDFSASRTTTTSTVSS